MIHSWESRYITVEGIQIHYLMKGKGSPLLLLHGLGASSITWRDNIGSLSENFQVYALDLPGHGDSDKPSIEYEPGRILRLIKLTIETLNMENPAIIGNSVGGSLALMMSLRYPNMISKTVLVNSSSLGKEINLYLRLISVPLLGSLLEGSGLKSTIRMLKNVFYDPSFITADLIDHLSRTRSSPGAKEAVVKVIRNSVNIGGVRDRYILSDRLQELKMPLLVIWGAQDRIFPVSHAYNAAATTNQVNIHVFEQCGHWPQMEKAEEFNSLVLKFLNG